MSQTWTHFTHIARSFSPKSRSSKKPGGVRSKIRNAQSCPNDEIPPYPPPTAPHSILTVRLAATCPSLPRRNNFDRGLLVGMPILFCKSLCCLNTLKSVDLSGPASTWTNPFVEICALFDFLGVYFPPNQVLLQMSPRWWRQLAYGDRAGSDSLFRTTEACSFVVPSFIQDRPLVGGGFCAGDKLINVLRRLAVKHSKKRPSLPLPKLLISVLVSSVN